MAAAAGPAGSGLGKRLPPCLRDALLAELRFRGRRRLQDPGPGWSWGGGGAGGMMMWQTL